MYDLQDKRILITGASKGLGRVCAAALEAEGARLALMARSEKRLRELIASFREPNRHAAFPGDLTDFEALSARVREAERALGGIDAVLHAAGAPGPEDPLLPWAWMVELLDINLGAAVEINRVLLPKMSEKGRGNVVHVCSIAGVEAGVSAAYNVSKAGLAAYVRTVGREMARTGVTVTGVLPGAFKSPDNLFSRLERFDPDAVERFVKARLPRARLGEAEELVPLLLLLCSDKASMMAGCCVPVDAGEGRAYNP